MKLEIMQTACAGFTVSSIIVICSVVPDFKSAVKLPFHYAFGLRTVWKRHWIHQRVDTLGHNERDYT